MSNSQNHRYEMNISLGILDHLGLNLYSNTPAVISEVIANAWDADATRVEVTIDTNGKTITVKDNGHGMDLADVNNRYLLVGYRRREEQGPLTPLGRKPMGRKGIGKLSLFSIARKIYVHTKKADSDPEAFLLDAQDIRTAVEDQNDKMRDKGGSNAPHYRPKPVDFDVHSLLKEYGTTVMITDLKRNLTAASVAGLRKRIARRFGLIAENFDIVVNDLPVTLADRDYFNKARFIFQYGDYNYAAHCQHLDKFEDTQEPLAFPRDSCFDVNGEVDPTGRYEVNGWIAIARHSNDLDDTSGDHDDNLNRITILMRGKVAQEDILKEYRIGGMITKFIFGEIHANFLDVDDDDDIATTSRQHLAEDNPRYLALKAFIERELRHIWTETNKLKEKRGLETAINSNPHLKEWYDNLPRESLKKSAQKIFRGIELANMDDQSRHDFYATAVLAFEYQKMKHALEELKNIDDANVNVFLDWLTDMDTVEAARYLEIVRQRLGIIDKLNEMVNNNDYEKVLQEYIFDHLWLLDPAWERATQYKVMEERLQNVVSRVNIRDKEQVRLDIRYRRVSGMHIIIELKRPGVKIRKTQIEDQVNDYINAVKEELNKDSEEARFPVEGICLLGELPIGWNDPMKRKEDEDSLRPYGIRVMTYTELINRAYSAYAKFVEARSSHDDLISTVDAIRAYNPSQNNE